MGLDLDVHINDGARICSKHFVTGMHK